MSDTVRNPATGMTLVAEGTVLPAAGLAVVGLVLAGAIVARGVLGTAVNATHLLLG